MKKRWHRKLKQEVKSPRRVEEFLIEVVELCRLHNVSISHEDMHGAFVIDEFKVENLEWLMDAHINT